MASYQLTLDLLQEYLGTHGRKATPGTYGPLLLNNQREGVGLEGIYECSRSHGHWNSLMWPVIIFLKSEKLDEKCGYSLSSIALSSSCADGFPLKQHE